MSDGPGGLLHVEVQPRKTNERAPGAWQFSQTLQGSGVNISAASSPITLQQRPPVGGFVVIWIDAKSIPQKSRSAVLLATRRPT